MALKMRKYAPLCALNNESLACECMRRFAHKNNESLLFKMSNFYQKNMARSMKNSGMKNLLIVFAFVMIIIPLALMLMKTIFGITLESFEDVKVPSIPSEYKQKRFGSNMLACRSPDGQSSCPEGTFCENSSSSCKSITVKGSSDVVGYFS